MTGTTGHGVLGIAREMKPAEADTQGGLAQNPLRMSRYANAEVPYRKGDIRLHRTYVHPPISYSRSPRSVLGWIWVGNRQHRHSARETGRMETQARVSFLAQR